MSHDSTPKPSSPKPPQNKGQSLEQLLRRQDVWRGHSRSFVQLATQPSGYSELDAALHKGWPLGCLVEVCQAFHACEWWLFHPAANALLQHYQGHIALLNPPALPFVAGLEKLQVDTRRLLVVQSKTAAEFVTCFTELSRCSACYVLLAWQPKQALNYTALRKLQLSTLERPGLYVLFRSHRARAQSSPASLRLMATPTHSSLRLNIFKQKGKLQESTVELPIPAVWQSLPMHRFLDDSQDKHHTSHGKTAHANLSQGKKGKGNIVSLNALKGGA